ncbi:hypothetical protein [Arenimonas sp.]|uniref:hypothetical protein n=1 Tax=Arenimonas sp. TaxID=1872635 RepID=UPI0025DDB50E|nr:hypothetical protein [Arenimonas sp.]
MTRHLSLATFALLALAGCSRENAPADAIADAPAPVPAGNAAPTREPAVAEPRGDCDLATPSEISAAFGGKLTVRRTSGSGGRGSSCTWSLAEVADSQIVLQAGDEAAYAARKQEYSRYRGVAMEPLPIGREAFLVNGTQVIALREDGQSISLGLMLIVYDSPLPLGEEEMRRGVETLAAAALARL